ncbi:hypothetical protein C8A03DRAFT_20074 [Achaetomium macrosporum]|uniref:Uncharacterized protein n=1 Tax=Achaetomium macrosporum TaxID=79813 RepID=A0AAN7H2S7_9PEZI|nr:hypothetical protein C8A03DRAFT_20074 [Achaetomium macrosporum]
MIQDSNKAVTIGQPPILASEQRRGLHIILFDKLFIRLPAFQTAICREHSTAVTAKSVASHVDLQHCFLAPGDRRRIVEEASALQDDGLLAADVDSIRFPNKIIPAIDGLPIWRDGKKCLQCGYIRRTRQHIQRHCRLEHGWVNPRGRGGKPGARLAGGLGEAWVDGVYCQRLGQTGALQRLFEVVLPASEKGEGQGESDGQGRGRL